jgi:hypothetical protein
LGRRGQHEVECLSARVQVGGRYGVSVDVDWNAEVVDQIDAHWRDRLRPRLSGLTDDEYFWQPVPGC